MPEKVYSRNDFIFLGKSGIATPTDRAPDERSVFLKISSEDDQ
jgi:hypothetical protein